jgi:ABC-type phosphate transport system substrate-binding protein
MKRAATAVCIVLLASVAIVTAQDAGYQVIAHPSTTPDSVSKRDLSRLFLKQKKSWSNGQKASPIDQKASSEVRRQFSHGVLGKSVGEVDAYWQGQVFSGKAHPPSAVGSDQEVVSFVRSTPGAVGYVSAGADTGGVKVLKITG